MLNYCPRVRLRTRREARWTGRAGFLLGASSLAPAGRSKNPGDPSSLRFRLGRSQHLRSRPFKRAAWMGDPPAHNLPRIFQASRADILNVPFVLFCSSRYFVPGGRTSFRSNARYAAHLVARWNGSSVVRFSIKFGSYLGVEFVGVDSSKPKPVPYLVRKLTAQSQSQLGITLLQLLVLKNSDVSQRRVSYRNAFF